MTTRDVALESRDDIELAERLKTGRDRILAEVRKRIVGQDDVIEQVLLSLFVGGNSLIVGVPGLAKTLMVRSLADAIDTTFRRIQFTPDLLPGDIVGTPIYEQGTGEFRVHKGPIFSQIVLADEVNRAPPKVQSALLEAMEEKQVTIAGDTFPLEEPFLVLATQNPIEHHGTYPLAEAQLDRFMMKLKVGYPTREQEKVIVRRDRDPIQVPRCASASGILNGRREVAEVHLDDKVLDYIVALVFATREPDTFGLSELEGLTEFGASPRATIFLARGARAKAYLSGRDFVLPDDVKAIAPPVLGHRMRTTYQADAKGIDSDHIIRRVLETVPTP